VVGEIHVTSEACRDGDGVGGWPEWPRDGEVRLVEAAGTQVLR
jgi:hypothetical protein